LHLDTVSVRPGEELNLLSLAGWVRGRIAGALRSITLEQFPSGHSNLTYLQPIDGVGEDAVPRRFAEVKGVIGLGSPETQERRRYRACEFRRRLLRSFFWPGAAGLL
jgi:hypothetical protein